MSIIALDADGVLVNYNQAFGLQWENFFGVRLAVKEPKAYHATTYWDIVNPDYDHPFWDHFDQHGWLDMPAMPGAVEACNRLVEAGHELVCVTSMPGHRELTRLQNLQNLGFPIQRVIATGSARNRGDNPKKEAIEALKPEWFVDDELRKLKELPGVNCVLVNPGHPDCPNVGQDKSYLAMEVSSLAEFTDRFLTLI